MLDSRKSLSLFSTGILTKYLDRGLFDFAVERDKKQLERRTQMIVDPMNTWRRKARQLVWAVWAQILS